MLGFLLVYCLICGFYADNIRTSSENELGRLFGIQPVNSSNLGLDDATIRNHNQQSHEKHKKRNVGQVAKEPVYHIFGPCTFPPPQFMRTYSTRPGFEAFQPASPSQFRQVCKTTPQLPFICDLHDTLNQHDLNMIGDQFFRIRPLFCGAPGEVSPLPFGILIVRHLAQPLSIEHVNRHNPEFECLFRLPCIPMDDVTMDKFIHNVRTFAKLYAAAVFTRWFPTIGRNAYSEEENDKYCANPRVMVLIMLDGVLSNPKKLTTVYLYTDNHSFQPFITNIHMETANLLLQGIPLANVISDLVQQIAFAYNDYRALGGQPRRHNIPMWAWYIVILCVSLAVLALIVEWLIVRKRFTRRRYIPGPVVDSLKSKAHMIF